MISRLSSRSVASPKKITAQFLTPLEISASGDLNLTPPRIRNNSYSEKQAV